MSELYIDESNFQYWTGAGNPAVNFDGFQRLLNFAVPQVPYGQVRVLDENNNLIMYARPFEDVMPLIPRDEWIDRIKEKDANGSWLKNTVGDIPVKDQDGLGYCFTLDTKISLLDGTERTLKELLSYDDPIWVYSYDKKSRRVVPGLACKPFKTRSKTPIVKVTLDNGESVRCTPDHKWMMRDGTYRRADALKSGDSLMPLYRAMAGSGGAKKFRPKGYELLLDPDAGWEFTYKRVAEFTDAAVDLVGDSLVPSTRTSKHSSRHHLNFDRDDNRPDNIVWIRYNDHRRYHVVALADRNRSDHARRVSSENLTKLHKDPVFAAKRDKATGDTFRRLWVEKKEDWSKLSSERMLKLQQDPGFQAASSAASSRSMVLKHQNPEFAARRDKRNNTPVECPECGKVCGNIGAIGCHIQAKHRESEVVTCECGREFNSRRGLASHAAQVHSNHKVVGVEPAGFEDVYDITVNKHHNFALSAGVFVHNCHAYGTVSVEEILHMVSTGQYYDLSAESVGGIVTGWKNRGADPMQDLAVSIKYGACEASYMDKPNSLSPDRWKAGWKQNALTHRMAEYYDLRVPGKVFDAVMTCYLNSFPIGLGYAWWSHFIHGGFRARYNTTKKCFDIEERNSWGKNYGDNGYFWLPEGTRNGQGTPDWAFAGRALLAA